MIDNYAFLPIDTIAENLKRDPEAVRSRAHVLRLKKRELVADFGDEIKQLAIAEYTIPQIAKKTGFHYATILSFLQENNIEVTSAVENRSYLSKKAEVVAHFNNGTFVEWFWYWFKNYREAKLRDITKQKYDNWYGVIRQSEIADKKLADVTRRDLQLLFDRWGKVWAKLTLSGFYKVVKASLRDAVIDQHILFNPAENIQLTSKETFMLAEDIQKEREKKRWLEVSEYQKLSYYLMFKIEKKLTEPVDDQTMTLMLFYTLQKTGARFAEVLGLTEKDIDFDKNLISINKTWDYKQKNDFNKTKNDASVRKIAIDDDLNSVLKKYINWLKSEFIILNKGAIFVWGENKIYNSTFNTRFKRLLKDIDIEPITIHQLRHTHASLLLAKGVQMQVVAKRLGHADTTMLQRVYGHLMTETEEAGNQLIRGLI